jgi:hypothetical protein
MPGYNVNDWKGEGVTVKDKGIDEALTSNRLEITLNTPVGGLVYRILTAHGKFKYV